MDDLTRTHLLAQAIVLRICFQQILEIKKISPIDLRETITEASMEAITLSMPPGSDYHHLSEQVVRQIESLLGG